MQTKVSKSRKEFLHSMLIEEYVDKNTTLRELSEKYKCCRKTLTKILKENNIPIKNRYHDIYLKNNFNKIDSEESSYWLGFIYADGSVVYPTKDGESRYVLELGLANKDENHLLKFKAFTGSHKTIEDRGISKRLLINSKDLVLNLKKLGILKRKTYLYSAESILKSIPKKFYKDFLRGFIDGDGSIDSKGIISITSYFKETIFYFLKQLPFYIEYKCYNKSNSKAVNVKIGKQKYSHKVLSYLYKNSTIFLDRKYQQAIAVLDRNI